MNQFKRTLNITGSEMTPTGPKLVYEFIRIDITKGPDESNKNALNKNILKGKSYTPKAGDKVYFYPGCNIPRFKLKEYCNTHKIAPTKFKVRSNVVIIGPEAYNNFFGLITRSRLSLDKFSKWLDVIFPIGDPRTLQLRYDMAEVNENYYYVLINSSLFANLTNPGTLFGIPINVKKDANGNTEGAHSNFVVVKSEDDYKTLSEMLDPISNFYSQDEILKDLNTGVVIDETIQEMLSDQFRSKDTENGKIAMTFMANSDYAKSATHILLLIREHGDKIGLIPNKNHVNFKSMLKFFGIDSVHAGCMRLDRIIDILITKGLLTTDAMNLLVPCVKEDMERLLTYKHFSCGKINFSKEIFEALDKSNTKETEKEYNNSESAVVERDVLGNPMVSVSVQIMDSTEKAT